MAIGLAGYGVIISLAGLFKKLTRNSAPGVAEIRRLPAIATENHGRYSREKGNPGPPF